ncbi:hypothetical protein ACFOGJ_03800 [Marinibaculum pumilum]|uniref:Heme oxygenase n=1 Tax=Marinibaculum pumilum TaxID=1766165 RepID=A0ABV7KVD3_9PROT
MDKIERRGTTVLDGQNPQDGQSGQVGLGSHRGRMAAGDPRDRLLAACGDLHGAVEAHPRMARLMSPDLDEAGLADSLAALHAGIARVEQWLAAAADPDLIDLLPLCDSAARLKADLLALTGRSAPGQTAAGPFVADALPVVMEPPAGAGSLWVLWGAHKGNAVVATALARGLYRRTAFRSRYFTTLPADRRRYDRLMRSLRRMPPADVDGRAVPQAMAAFRTLHDALAQAPAPLIGP